MSPIRELGSPIRMSIPHRHRNEVRTELPSTPSINKKGKLMADFVKYGHPYKLMDRFFVGLEPRFSGINAVEFTQDAPVAFVKKLEMSESEVAVHRLMETSHPNLVNLQEVFISERSIFFVYERWGITLKEIQDLQPIFRLGEVEVATICREILQGLLYIHRILGISHGAMSETSVSIAEDGGVKIADIGESMVRESGSRGKFSDIQAVLGIARTLLDLKGPSGGRGTMGLLAHDFTQAPPTVTIEELLEHPFLTFGTGPWCLRPVNILCTIAQRASQYA
ncbi:hypothetical protein KXV25_005403 [Aspergillus fumigatus]|nr:hypothetical protein KXW63_002877 [Aspergillus fumigatus]KAH2977124.1 hypothetical protein KXV25_005403 [Aspergillus fumigatus]KAH3504775.1 hypothetical protein KXW24_007711 [Aspergillus fumigatus]